MNRLALVALVSAAASGVFVAGRPDKTPTPSPATGRTFTLPAGFEVELVAGPPLIDRPIMADFDDEGRLYVADSSGSNDPVDQQLKQRPHRIIRLEDVDGDGKFDKATVFADKMMFPAGVLCFDGSVYVGAPPTIWKLTDADGDGVAEQRTEWFQGKTLTGCANDLHGPYAGPDGWIYWCKGAFAEQTYERPGRKPFVTRAAHIFRRRPEGGPIEPVMTGGMDNPVEVVFTPSGERIFTTTFFQHPGGGRRDGLVHAIYGGVYGKDHDVLDSHPHTSPALMPVLTHLGPAAPSGLMRYESAAFGPAYRDNLFAALFNLRKVTRHVLQPNGATFVTRDEDFLISEDRDFHPTDVLEDADGSLLVIDTGGWYKLCCPTSQLRKPDVLGGIYRVRKKGAPRVVDPRGLKLPWAKLTATELVDLLDDGRPAVRRRAIHVLAKRRGDALPVLADALKNSASVEKRRNAVWTATRIEGPAARGVIRPALTDVDESVRHAAAHAVSVRRDREAVDPLIAMLRDQSAACRRVAAEALGRLGDSKAVPPLLEAVRTATDRTLEHSLIYALIEIADPTATAAGLKNADPRVRKAALTAIDQMEGGFLSSDAVTAELDAKDAALRETAAWLAGRHPEWGGALAGHLKARLSRSDRTPAESDELVQQLVRLAKSEPVQRLLAEQMADPKAPRTLVLRVMAQAGLNPTPADWSAAVVRALGVGDLAREAVRTLGRMPVSDKNTAALKTALLTLAADQRVDAVVRLGALANVPGGLTSVDPSLFDWLKGRLQRDEPVAERNLAADILARAALSSEQLLALCEALKTVGPMEAARLLEAFGRSKDDAVGSALVAALLAAPARAGLRVDMIKPRLAAFSAKVHKAAEALYAELDADAGRQQARLEELLAKLEPGDVRRGQAVFNGTKAACATCHAVGYVGGDVGPDLTAVGRIRTERDLLESIVFPSASFVRGFEPVLVTLKDGRALNGVVRRESPEEIVLATGAGQETRIARNDVEEMQPGKVSVMPAGLDQQLTPRELSDLVAFLKGCK
jgi:putative membrane-bound dehydrogenase-like protein